MQQQASVALLGPVGLAQGYCDTVVVFGEAGFRELEFQFTENLDCSQNFLRSFADALGHLDEDSVNFEQLFFQQANQFVVLFNCFQRLDEDGLTAGACAVHDALYAAKASSIVGEYMRDNSSPFAWPAPCSPESDPPKEMTRSAASSMKRR